MSSSLSFLSGPVAMLPTFFAGDRLDLEVQARHTARLLAAGCPAFVLGGAEGEGPTLADGEHDRLLSATADRLGTQALGLAICSPCTHRSVMRAAAAERAGATFLVVTPPPYNKPTQAGIRRHVEAIAGATRLPVIVRDEPDRTRIGLDDETIAHLCRLPTVAAIAFAAGDFRRAALADHHSRGRVQAICGSDFDAVLGQSDERCGWLSSAINIDPDRCLDLWRSRLNGDWRTSIRIGRDLCRLLRALDLSDRAVTVKYVLGRLYRCHDAPRLPLVSLPDEVRRTLDAVLDRLDLGDVGPRPDPRAPALSLPWT